MVVAFEEFKMMKLAKHSLEAGIRRRLIETKPNEALTLGEVAWVTGRPGPHDDVLKVLNNMIERGLVECREGGELYYRWVR